ncbi:MAG: glutamine-hydrolyzing carbamoyl-phosphate synthase small subunit [Parcubacteria group bacterium]|nr:glutamine-hydrolyzing carbamoyl-phosphate synthase small subunit [Parcubacteria group bacterium]
MTQPQKPAKIILKDGSTFTGIFFGQPKAVAGEVVFNTGMVGYPETLTDPSYRGQILVLTYPLIGNYGVPGKAKEDGLLKYFESDEIHIQGLIVADYSANYSHWNAKKSLGEWLQEHDIPGVTGIDTRELTKKLREQGTMLGKIVYGRHNIEFIDPNKKNLAAEVSVQQPVLYKKGRRRIILIDCGTKNNIIRSFLRRNISVLRVPWDYDFTREKADGIVISNGPGDPKMCQKTIRNVRKALKGNTPILGICLGAQILALAARANTYKLKYGHRGQNQPCLEVGTKRCYITSQNHGYAVDSRSIPRGWREWFVNNNDQTNEGIIHTTKPFYGAQFHPEASPGPDDTEFIFDAFVKAVNM